MKRFDLVFATALVGLAVFVGSEALETREALASRSGGGETLVTNEAPAVAAPPDFLALDRLLEATGAAGADGPAGYVISQLLGHTS